MPRAITDSAPAPAPGGPRQIEFPLATVDAPDAYYTGARARIDGNGLLQVMNRQFEVLAEYALEQPTATGRSEGAPASISALVDGKPLTVAKANGCGCHGTTVVPK